MLADRFRLVRPLGSGGLGEVWLAEDVREGRELALKLLAGEHSRHPARIDRFRREFSVAQSLVHPAIVRPEEFVSDGNSHFFTMPALPGGHVGECSDQPWSASARRLLPVCDALAYAHRKGVVHGDIKPHNILLDESGAACLTDFGAAVLPDAADDGRIRRPGGSLAYLSPQRLEGRSAGPAMTSMGWVVSSTSCCAAFRRSLRISAKRLSAAPNWLPLPPPKGSRKFPMSWPSWLPRCWRGTKSGGR